MGTFKGRYATIIALMCCMAAATIGVAQNTPGVFYTPVAEDLGILKGTYSFFGTAQALSIALTVLITPQLLRTFGIKWLIMLSMVGMSGSTVVLAFAESLPIIYLCGAVRGFSACIACNIPITVTINNWFHKANGTATSIALSFSGLAGAACSPILTWFITHYDWHIAYLVQAALLFGLMLPPFFIPLHVTPQEEGLVPFGAEDLPEDAAAGKDADTAESARPFSFKSQAFISMASFIFLFMLVTGLAQHISGYATSIGLSAGFGALLLSLSMVGNICAKLLIGILTDKFGALKASATMIVLNVVALVLIFVGARSVVGWMMGIGAVLYGSVYAIGAVGSPLLTRLFFGDGNYTKAFPVISFTASIGCAIAIPAMGYVYDFTGTYDYAVLGCLVIDVIVMFLLLRAHKASRA